MWKGRGCRRGSGKRDQRGGRPHVIGSPRSLWIDQWNTVAKPLFGGAALLTVAVGRAFYGRTGRDYSWR